MRKYIFISIVIVGLVACKAVVLSTPSQTDIDRVKSSFPGYTLVELQEGKKLYEVKCQGCHNLKKPRSASEEKWRGIVPSMVEKALSRNIKINTEEQSKILKYLITMSSEQKK